MAVADGLREHGDGKVRCWWPGEDPFYMRYHDEEWGRPVTDDVRLFEKICLEGFQSGLSWITILRKRENFRAAFAGFDFNKVAGFGDDDIARLLADTSIVRHRGKIVSTINNAARAVAMKQEFGSLAAYFWSHEPPAAERPAVFTYQALIANPVTPASIRLSKDLKKRGWTFVGPTTCYAFMQAMGLVNDHVDGCHCRGKVEMARINLAHDSGNLTGFTGPLRADMLRLRKLVLNTAAKNPLIGPVCESIKWGEASYTPAKKGIGSSLRIAPRPDGQISMNFICHTGLIGRFREMYGGRLNFEGDRTIIIDPSEPLPMEELGHCIAMALTYFRSKA